MSVMDGGDGITRISFLGYQGFMLILVALICLCLAGFELMINRFQALPVIFPGMFSVHNRRFHCFDVDVSDGRYGKQIRAQAKLLTRITICVLLCYVWQNTVLITEQVVGKGFPDEQCSDDFDCFASELNFLTLLTWEYTEVDCSARTPENFEDRVVITCMKFVDPEANNWLMHLAIAHSLGQLHFRCYELLTWVAAKSALLRRILALSVVVTLLLWVVLFFAEVLSEFLTSWLSYVMAFSLPGFLFTVWRSGHALAKAWLERDKQIQRSLEQHLSNAFKDIESVVSSCKCPTEDELSQKKFAQPGMKLPHRLTNGVDRILSSIRAFRDKTMVISVPDATSAAELSTWSAPAGHPGASSGQGPQKDSHRAEAAGKGGREEGGVGEVEGVDKAKESLRNEGEEAEGGREGGAAPARRERVEGGLGDVGGREGGGLGGGLGDVGGRGGEARGKEDEEDPGKGDEKQAPPSVCDEVPLETSQIQLQQSS